MLERFFRLSQHGTTVRTELLAGLTTFLTMAYIIFVQPAVLSGSMFDGIETGMDFHAVTMATCLAAALASLLMGLYARLPIALAPGMGENFFFVLSVLPAVTTAFAADIAADETSAWQIGLGVVFVAGVLFLLISVLGVQKKMLQAISPSMRNGIAIGIGLFIAFIGLQNTGLLLKDPGTALLRVPGHRRVVRPAGARGDRVGHRGGDASGGGPAVRPAASVGRSSQTGRRVEVRGDSQTGRRAEVRGDSEAGRRAVADAVVSAPPSVEPTFFKMDLARALSWSMLPFILIFLFMDLFDTLGTLIGVAEQAHLVKDGELPGAKPALISDAVGTVAGAAMGTSTVTSFIESAAGVEQGGRTGLTAVTVAGLFLLAIFFSPVIAMVGSYPPITAPALVVVGSLMMANAGKVQWSNYAESIPTFLIIIGIPLTYSIADGLALGFIAYPIVKLLAGQGRDVKWLMYVMAAVLVAYFVFVRMGLGG